MNIPVTASDLPEDLSELDLDLKDRDNPHSLVNMLPNKVGDALMSIPNEILTMTDHKLKKLGNIGITENRLRHAFWLEYGNAHAGKRQMRIANVHNGVCRKEYWYHIVVKDVYKMAYIFSPPNSYKVTMSELVEMSVESLREVLETPHLEEVPVMNNRGEPILDRDGQPMFYKKINSAIASAKIKVADLVMNRVYGAATQKIKIDQRVMSTNMPTEALPNTLEEIDNRIRALEDQKTGKLLDVTKRSEEASEDSSEA